MIRYALKCDNRHGFDSWFKSASAFEALLGQGMIGCPTCGSTGVEKAVMAPQLRPSRSLTQPAPPAPGPGTGGMLSKPSGKVEIMLAELRRRIEASSDYVGQDFAAVARQMHDGEIPERSIHGEARIDDARSLIEDGVPVAPLPFMPQRKTN